MTFEPARLHCLQITTEQPAMPMWFTNIFAGQNDPTPMHGGHDHGDLPVDDPPPMDHPAEQYSSWRATAIFNLAPFSSPPGR